MHSYQGSLCLPYFIFESLCQLIGTLMYYRFFIQQLRNFLQRSCKKQIEYADYALQIAKYLSRESNKKIATANIQQYFVDLVRNYSFTLS